MICEIQFDGLEPIAAMEVAVDRWAARLDGIRPIDSCAVKLAIAPGLFSTRAHIALAVTISIPAETAEDHDLEIAIELTRSARYRERADLYALIYDAFRDAHHRLTGRDDDRAVAGEARALRHA